MKFVYEYRSSDNVRHTGVVRAFNREQAFTIIKKNIGVRPSRVTEAPGFANKILRIGIRGLVIILLLIILAGMSVYFITEREKPGSVKNHDDTIYVKDFENKDRRQIIGDKLLIEKGIRTGWADVFELEGERFLASFAIPGSYVAVKNTSEEKIREALNHKIQQDSNRGVEAQQIISIVEGMKDELREYCASGGTIVGYGERLVERQEKEFYYYKNAKDDILAAERKGVKNEDLIAIWEEKNTALRRMGIKIVPISEIIEE